MSLNKMAASTSYRRSGCRVISVTSSGRAQDSSMGMPSRTLRYSGSERPAWRMNQTGVYGTGSLRHARTKSEFSWGWVTLRSYPEGLGQGLKGDRAAIFNRAVGGLGAGGGWVLEEGDDISFEDSPPPRRLAPYAAAMGAVAYRDGIEAGSGRLVLLYDPDGQEGWTGVFRLVAY